MRVNFSILANYKLQQLTERMINEITINFNNAIDLSRGELLTWVNDLLNTNLTKIQQLGTGAIFCQLIDVLYPGKIQLSKVNWKAKYDYEFVSNFKILQQGFTKLGIMKNIEVQKLVKCKYQDNLQFLQWFKKIFDSNGVSSRENITSQKKLDMQPLQERKKDRQNKLSQPSTSSKDLHSNLYYENQMNPSNCASFIVSDHTDQNDNIIRYSGLKDCSKMFNPPNSPDENYKTHDSRLSEANRNAFEDERDFYLKKFKEIEHLCQEWKTQRSSSELIEQIRKIILVAPNVDWGIQQGQFVIRNQVKQNACQ